MKIESALRSVGNLSFSILKYTQLETSSLLAFESTSRTTNSDHHSPLNAAYTITDTFPEVEHC